MLAKNANDNACNLNQRGVLEFFASKLAPTAFWWCATFGFIDPEYPCAVSPDPAASSFSRWRCAS
ncbi:hypothetical protein EUX53_21090 [Pseudomonas orientalis]|nr:hypothetical protein EUX53_21090 [Pseudomonas orientalis]